MVPAGLEHVAYTPTSPLFSRLSSRGKARHLERHLDWSVPIPPIPGRLSGRVTL